MGEDWGTPVSPTYKPPFKFTGTLKKVTVEVTQLSGQLQTDQRKPRYDCERDS